MRWKEIITGLESANLNESYIPHGILISRPGKYMGPRKPIDPSYVYPDKLDEKQIRVDLPGKYIVVEVYEELEQDGNSLVEHSTFNINPIISTWITERGLEKAHYDKIKECAFYIFDDIKIAQEFKKTFGI